MGLKKAGKEIVKTMLMKSGALGMMSRIACAGAVVLMYHSIVESPEDTANAANFIGMSQPRSSFETHIQTIAQRFHPVTIEQVARFAKGSSQLPAKSVAVTFDDGFADNYAVAMPILNRYGVPAAFYIMIDAVETGCLPWYCRIRYAFMTTRMPEWNDQEEGRIYRIQNPQEKKLAMNKAYGMGARRTGKAQKEFIERIEKSLEVEPLGRQSGLMMDWDEVRALKRAGHIVGAHTLSHPNLAHVSKEEARSEIVGCKMDLEQRLDGPVEHFSYPNPALNPQWNSVTLQITREAGFKSAVLTTRGPVRRGDEPLALKRIYAANQRSQLVWDLERTFLGDSA